MISISIAGDIYPGSLSTPHMREGDATRFLDGLTPALDDCHLRIANLEGPFVSALDPVSKIGPLHQIHEGCITGLKAAGFDVLNLANNHVTDHGNQGLANTMRICRQHGIDYVGAGQGMEEAGRPLIREVEGIRVAILSYTEDDVGTAKASEPGTNHLDIIHFCRSVQANGTQWDILVVLLHAGNEYFPYPRPSLREMARFMIEQGAAAVIFQHSHCPGCCETYEGGHIVYGQGDLLFDERGSRECAQQGFLVFLDASGPGQCDLRILPYRQSDSHPGPIRLQGTDEAAFRKELEERAANLDLQGFLEKEWERFSRQQARNYLALLHGVISMRVREFDRKFHFLRFLYSKRRMRMLRHLVRNESHRESIIEALDDFLGSEHP